MQTESVAHGQISALELLELGRLLPDRVEISAIGPAEVNQGLFPEEWQLIACAAPARRQDFIAGRVCARRALAQIGAPEVALTRVAGKYPKWPPGYIGSITHCRGFRCAVVASTDHFSSIGIDVELEGELDECVSDLVCRGDERIQFIALPPLSTTNWAKLAFSAKESVYKCFYPLTHQFLSFHDVRIEFSPQDNPCRGSFHAVVEHRDYRGTTFRGRWWIGFGRVHTSALPLDLARSL